MDFGFGNEVETNNESVTQQEPIEANSKTNLETGEIVNENGGEATTSLENNTSEVSNNEKNEQEETKVNALEEGTTIEVDNNVYTVDKDGNILDKDGNIFKEAKDAQEWIKSFEEVSETNSNLSVKELQDIVGIEILDDNDNVIEFENNPKGIKAYIDAVMETERQEHYETAINTLYQKYPILNDVLNYYIANGNSLEGFGELPDRSNVNIDDTNEAQQESIIRMAWEERGQKGDVSAYINYLKSTGILLATAKEELEALKEKDTELKRSYEEEAQRRERERMETLENYWKGVENVINSRKIGQYEIPESIVINRNGQKLSVTPRDFFNYIYQVDKNGISAYEKDLANETPESRRDDEILRAYLKFVGGNYSNLVDMAINKEKVNKLKLTAKSKTTTKARITKPTVNKKDDINFGY